LVEENVTAQTYKVSQADEGSQSRPCTTRQYRGIRHFRPEGDGTRPHDGTPDRGGSSRDDYIKRGGKIWIRVFPDKPITKKPLEVRQGKGKGNVEYWVCQIQPGRVLYEMEGVTEEIAREAFRLAAAKLPFQTEFVTRQVM
jgi:hypothetical protein